MMREITYPPEMLPVPDDADDEIVIVIDGTPHSPAEAELAADALGLLGECCPGMFSALTGRTLTNPKNIVPAAVLLQAGLVTATDEDGIIVLHATPLGIDRALGAGVIAPWGADTPWRRGYRHVS